jgi:hypothetical protein
MAVPPLNNFKSGKLECKECVTTFNGGTYYRLSSSTPNFEPVDVTKEYLIALKIKERKFIPPELLTPRKYDLISNCRGVVIEWITHVCNFFNFSKLTTYLAIALFDRALSLLDVRYSFRGNIYYIS